MSFIPEDRLGMGLVAGMSIIDNNIKRFKCRKVIVDRKVGKKAVSE